MNLLYGIKERLFFNNNIKNLEFKQAPLILDFFFFFENYRIIIISKVKMSYSCAKWGLTKMRDAFYKRIEYKHYYKTTKL